jgi:type II secretory pathway pseudopilin PulG
MRALDTAPSQVGFRKIVVVLIVALALIASGILGYYLGRKSDQTAYLYGRIARSARQAPRTSRRALPGAVRTKIENLAQPRAKEKLLAHFTAARPDATKYKAIYPVFASSPRPLPNGLSFFRKVAMMNAVRRLFALGYEGHMCRVPFGPAAH